MARAMTTPSATQREMRPAERAATGLVGLVTAFVGLWALVFPAMGILYLTDGYHFDDPASTAIGIVGLGVMTAFVSAVLILAAGLIRPAATGSWPQWRQAVGRRAAAGAFVATATFAVLVALVI